jgi:hypothetical protein
MATWVACIVETKGRADFWEVARKSGVRRSTDAVPAHALIDCDSGSDFLASVRLAEVLSRQLATMAIGFIVQTTADVHVIHVYDRGERLRRLEYNRDEGGWGAVEGVPQAWESAYFSECHPDDESDAGALPHPSSTAPMWRVCESLAIETGAEPSGVWRKPSLWSRLFGAT